MSVFEAVWQKASGGELQRELESVQLIPKTSRAALFQARCPKCTGDEGCSVARVVDGDVEEPLSNHRHDLRG